MAALTNLTSKLVRAVRFYFVDSGAVDADHCYHTFDSRLRKIDLPIVDVTTRAIGPEEQYTGNDDYILEIRVSYQAAVQQGAASADAQRIKFDAMVGAIRTLMVQSTDGGQTLHGTRDAINAAAAKMPVVQDPDDPTQVQFAADNADMADFTMLKLYLDVQGNATVEDTNWRIVQRFRCSCAESPGLT